MSAYRAPLFEPKRLRGLKLLPTEYLYYYYRPARSREDQGLRLEPRPVRRKTHRGFISGPQDPRTPRPPCSLSALPRRPRCEHTQLKPALRESKLDWAELSATTRSHSSPSAPSSRTRARSSARRSNRGTFPFLEDDDIIEVPCQGRRDRPAAERRRTIPDHPRELITSVKQYERATIDAL